MNTFPFGQLWRFNLEFAISLFDDKFHCATCRMLFVSRAGEEVHVCVGSSELYSHQFMTKVLVDIVAAEFPQISELSWRQCSYDLVSGTICISIGGVEFTETAEALWYPLRYARAIWAVLQSWMLTQASPGEVSDQVDTHTFAAVEACKRHDWEIDPTDNLKDRSSAIR